jgi:hypothetical protein
MKMIKQFVSVATLSAICAALMPAASAEEPGTMDLAPGTAFARTMTDDELGKQRGGFMGIAFSATFTATVENVNGTVTGTGTATGSTTGIAGTSPPVNYNIQGGTVQLSSYIGNLSGLNGVFQLTSVNGIGNVVNSHLTLNIALVNLSSGAQFPNMQSLFGQ